MRKTAVSEATPTCPKCKGTGFRLPIALDRSNKSHIPAMLLFREGMPCDCPAGPTFALMQKSAA